MIYFYNTFHIGDVHYSREFVKDMMVKLEDLDYCYLHNNNSLLLKDIDNLSHDNAFVTFNNWQLKTKYPFSYNGDVLNVNEDTYINTWIGQGNMKYIKNKGCNLYTNYDMFGDIYNKLGIEYGDIEDYNPSINFSNLEISDIIKDDGKVKILLCNNMPRTLSFNSIDLTDVAKKLSEEFSDVLFILSNDTDLNRDNVVHLSNLTNVNFDLNELGKISTYCDIIVGKPSGPFCFTHIKDNLEDENKIFITCSEEYNNNLIWYKDSKSVEELLTNNDDIINYIKNKIK